MAWRGARDEARARAILRQGLVCALVWAAALGALGVSIAGPLPHWLHGAPEIRSDATRYFFVFILSLPVAQTRVLCSGMLQASGDTRTSGGLNFASMWFVRLPLAAWLVMTVELCVRSALFLARLASSRWSRE